MVKEYFNRYIVNDENGFKRITPYNVYILDYQRIKGCTKVLLYVPKHDEEYEVCYDRKTGEISSSISIKHSHTPCYI